MKPIFLHIPKNAGVSIYHTLKEGLWDVQGYLKNNNIDANEERSIFYGHIPTWQLIRDKKVPAEYFADAIFFYVQRNVYTRAASLYYFQDWEKKGLSFEQALEKSKDLPGHLWSMWHNQVWWLQGIPTGQTKRIRFEHLQKDFNWLCKELEIGEFNLQYLNPNKNYSMTIEELYQQNPKAQELVQSIYREDIEFFGDTFPF